MTRNAVISGLSRALVVVEAGETGGTLAAGLHALDRGQPVLVLQLFGAPVGNQILLDKGATPIRSREELESRLTDLPTNGSAQLSLI
jgi:DNA processing protein